MITKQFIKKFTQKASIRAIKTIAQTALGVISTSCVISNIDWRIVVSSSVVAGIVSILTSIATGLPEVDKER